MYREFISYQSHSQIVVDNTPENRLSEEQFYAGLSLNDSQSLVVGEWHLGRGRVWMTVENTLTADFMLRAKLAVLGICVGEHHPYVLNAVDMQVQ